MISVKVRIRLNLDLQHRLLNYQYQNYFFFNIWRGNLIPTGTVLVFLLLNILQRDILRGCRAPVQVSPFRGMTSRRDSSGPSTSVCIFLPFLIIFVFIFSFYPLHSLCFFDVFSRGKFRDCTFCDVRRFMIRKFLTEITFHDDWRFVTGDMSLEKRCVKDTLWVGTFCHFCLKWAFCARGRLLPSFEFST